MGIGLPLDPMQVCLCGCDPDDQSMPISQRLRCYQARPFRAILIDEAVGYNAQNQDRFSTIIPSWWEQPTLASLPAFAVSSSQFRLGRCVRRFWGNGQATSEPSLSCMDHLSVWMTDLRPEQDTKHNIPNLSLDPISQEELATSPSTDKVFFFLFLFFFFFSSFFFSSFGWFPFLFFFICSNQICAIVAIIYVAVKYFRSQAENSYQG